MTPPLTYKKFWIALGWLGVLTVFIGSMMPGEQVPNLPGGDKSHHFIAYSSLMFWFGQLYLRRRFRVALALIAMGVAIEFLQPRLSNRMFDLADILANSIGVAIGLAVLLTPMQRFIGWLDQKVTKW